MLRVRTVWSGVAGAPFYSNHYFNAASGPDEAFEAKTSVGEFWTSLQGAIVNDLTAVVEGAVSVINPVNGDLTGVISGGAITVNATGTTDALPPFSQGLIHWGTDLFVGSRRLVGRTFVPGPLEANCDNDGSPSAAYVAALLIAGQMLIDSSSNFSVWSRTHGVVASVTGQSAGTQFAILSSRRD